MTEDVFVKRENELAKLHAYFDKAVAGQGQVAFVTGEAGAGKSYLVREFARQAQINHPNLLFAIGECSEQSRITDAFLPFREILNTLLGDVDQRVNEGAITAKHAHRLKKTAARIAEILVELGPMLITPLWGAPAMVLGRTAQLLLQKTSLMDKLKKKSEWQEGKRYASGTPFEEASAPTQIFEQYTQVLLKVAKEHPLLLILDDLQWADASSLDLLFHLGRKSASGRILVLGTYRPQDVAQGRAGQRHPLERVVHELQRYQGLIEVSLDIPSSSQEIRQFVTEYLERNYPPHAFDAAFMDGLVQCTGGHPLFLSEWLKNLALGGVIGRDADGLWRAARPVEVKDLPPRIEAVIAERVARLEPDLRDLLQAASVQGETFTAQVLARVRGIEESSLIPRLTQDLEKRHGLIRSQGATSEYGLRLYPFRFQHNLFQDYVYHQLSVPERETLHAQTGRALEDLYAENIRAVVAALAHHFSQAHLDEKALPYLVQAANQRLASYAYSEALDLYDRAVAIRVEDPKPWVYLQRARILRFVGRTAEGWESLQQAQSGFERVPDPYGVATAAQVEGEFYHFAGDYAKAIERFEGCLEAFRALPGKKKDEAITFSRLGETLRLKSEYARAIEAYRRGLELFDSLGEPMESAWMIHGLGGVTREQGKYAEALAFYEDAKRRFQELENPHGLTMALYGIGDIRREERRFPDALATYEEALALAERLHDTNLYWHLKIEMGKVFGKIGDYGRAISILEASLQALGDTGNRAGVAYASRNLGDVYRAMGNLDGALVRLFNSLKIDEEIRGWKGLAEDHQWIAEIHEEKGNLVVALEHIQKALGFYEQMGSEPGIKAAGQTRTRITSMQKQLREEDAASASWATGAKMGVGTAYTYEVRSQDNPSKVWFTLADGAITEVMYPTIDIANVKAIKCLVSDREGFIHDETRDCVHTVSLLDKQALAYRVVSVDKKGRYRLSKEIVTDPKNHTVLVQVYFEALQGEPADYRLYLYYVPYLGNSGEGGSGSVDQKISAILTWDRDIYAALKVSPHWRHASLRYVLADDVLPAGNGRDRPTDRVDSSRIAFVLQLPATEVSTVALGFGRSAQAAIDAANASLARGFEQVKEAYVASWQKYCQALHALDGGATDFYYLSAMVIKAHEDKTHRGAIVASLSLPWGNRRLDKEEDRGYRYVWPRDLYHCAMALLAAGDSRTVVDILSYLDEVLQRFDGSFPQNAYVDGTPYWASIQMDEVAVPIIIAWWLTTTDRYQSLIKPAADYLVRHGPVTPQERWEENNGHSPATIAAEIAGLVCAADLAKRAGDHQSAASYLAVADEWQRKVEEWCFTTNGPIADGRYYIRVSPEGNPNADHSIRLAHGRGLHDQRQVIDPSFLELVRLGVRDAKDPYVVESLPKIDRVLKVVTPRGPGWYRYNFDDYGELEEGGAFPGKGHLWTLLTGERGVYELARGNLDEAKLCLETMEGFANEGWMLPEQVWEKTGQGTGSATPLVWAHAEYIVLLKSIATGDIADRPSVVYHRYVGGTRHGKA